MVGINDFMIWNLAWKIKTRAELASGWWFRDTGNGIRRVFVVTIFALNSFVYLLSFKIGSHQQYDHWRFGVLRMKRVNLAVAILKVTFNMHTRRFLSFFIVRLTTKMDPSEKRVDKFLWYCRYWLWFQMRGLPRLRTQQIANVPPLPPPAQPLFGLVTQSFLPHLGEEGLTSLRWKLL